MVLHPVSDSIELDISLGKYKTGESNLKGMVLSNAIGDRHLMQAANYMIQMSRKLPDTVRSVEDRTI